jgi:S-formylglutathione hydrolase FrmB
MKRRTRRGRRGLGTAVLALLALPPALAAPPAFAVPPALAVPPPPIAAPALAARPAVSFTDGDGLHVVSETQVDSRLLALTVTTPALAGPTDIRVLLPAGYAADPTRRYPVLYLLPGTSGSASDWTTLGGAEQTTGGLPLIVVMPDIDLDGTGGGWCTNSLNGGAGGPPEWETYHVDELVPWIDANLRTIPSRDGRAIVGLSQGGFCSMSYAARHPDLFAIAGAFSGADDTAYDAAARALVEPVVAATAVALDGVAPFAFFGNPLTDEINWADHDPTTLAPNLRDTDLFMYTGNGQPGPLDPPPTSLSAAGSLVEGEALEAGVHELTTLFHRRLVSLGIPSYLDDYGPGTHSWPYWARDLQQSIGSIMADFEHPPAVAASVTYTSADPTYSVYGWTVSMHRPVEEFSTLERAGTCGFALAGSGAASVATPAWLIPGERYAVTLRLGFDRRTSTSAQTADASGRLVLTVPLGPPNRFAQDSPAAALTGTRVFTTTVSIAAAAGRAQPSTARVSRRSRGARRAGASCRRAARRTSRGSALATR